MKRLRVAGLLGLALLLFSAAAGGAVVAETENGAEAIMIDAGKKGTVFFPHWRHQETESITCQACHELFPKEPGSISRLKSEGSLKSRQVMNGLCISCHKETAKAGKPSGPSSCSVCHAK